LRGKKQPYAAFKVRLYKLITAFTLASKVRKPVEFSSPHVAAIRTQSTFMPVGEQSVGDLKRQQQSLKTMARNLRREAIDASLSPSLLRSPMLARDKGASSWLSAVPLEKQGLTLNKQQFRDSLCLRYNMQLAVLPSYCACGDRFTVSHALSCKKGVLLHKDMMASRTFSRLCSAKSARMSR